MPPTHEALLVDVLLLTIGEGVCIHIELRVHGAQGLDVIAGVQVVMVTLDIMIVVTCERVISV